MDIDQEDHLWVYRYRSWDEDKQEMTLSSAMATLDAIRNGLGIPALESATRVPLADVDSSGRHRAYRPSTADRPSS